MTNPYPGSAGTDKGTWHASEVEDLQISQGNDVRKLGETSQAIGGDFKVVKHLYHESENSAPQDFSTTANPFSPGRHHYAPQVAWTPESYGARIRIVDYPADTSSSKIALQALGATAIARVLPTNPVAGLTVFLGELRQGIPRLCGADFFKGRSSLAKSAGSEYLNREFGWLPLISDVRRFTHAVRNSQEITDQYVRNSGRKVKRHYSFPIEESVVVLNEGSRNAHPVLTPTGFYNGSGQGTRIRTTSTKTQRWFKGCFTYYLPPIDAAGGHGKRNEALRNKLYGTRITPETLWNLAPWSWAADWFGNTGDVLRNVSAFQSDGLVMPYGYIMETKTVTVSYTLTGCSYKSYAAPKNFSNSLTTVVKQRRTATPFGFGFDWGSLSSRQNLILAALGLSRHG